MDEQKNIKMTQDSIREGRLLGDRGAAWYLQIREINKKEKEKCSLGKWNSINWKKKQQLFLDVCGQNKVNNGQDEVGDKSGRITQGKCLSS